MKIAVVDERAEAFGLALSLKDQGHEVVHVAAVPAYNRVGAGLVDKAPSLAALLPESLGVDVYLVFASGLGLIADVLRRHGRAVVGGNAWVDRLGVDHLFAASFAESCGLRMPEWRRYEAPEEALAAMRADPRKYVVQAGSASFASDVPELLRAHVRRLTGWPIFVSPYVPGVDVYLETWFQDGRNVFSLMALENCSFMDGDGGPALEPQTSVAWALPMLEPRAYQNVTKKLEVLLAHQKYTGPVGVRLRISERDRKPYLLGFRGGSARHVHAMRKGMGFHVEHFAAGVSEPASFDFAYSAAVSVQPYPASAANPVLATAARGAPVFGRAYLWAHDVEADAERAGELMVAGTSGLVGDVVGYGNTVDAARRQAMAQLDNVLVHGMQARRGGGASRLARDIARLAALGYETPKVLKEAAA